jgi:hypothetical protein
MILPSHKKINYLIKNNLPVLLMVMMDYLLLLVEPLEACIYSDLENLGK